MKLDDFKNIHIVDLEQLLNISESKIEWPPLTDEQKARNKEIIDLYLNAPPLEELPILKRQ